MSSLTVVSRATNERVAVISGRPHQDFLDPTIRKYLTLKQELGSAYNWHVVVVDGKRGVYLDISLMWCDVCIKGKGCSTLEVTMINWNMSFFTINVRSTGMFWVEVMNNWNWVQFRCVSKGVHSRVCIKRQKNVLRSTIWCCGVLSTHPWNAPKAGVYAHYIYVLFISCRDSHEAVKHNYVLEVGAPVWVWVWVGVGVGVCGVCVHMWWCVHACVSVCIRACMRP